jgi:hypothetical protein
MAHAEANLESILNCENDNGVANSAVPPSNTAPTKKKQPSPQNVVVIDSEDSKNSLSDSRSRPGLARDHPTGGGGKRKPDSSSSTGTGGKSPKVSKGDDGEASGVNQGNSNRHKNAYGCKSV